MEPTIRPYTAPDGDAVVALSLRAWEPVFASVERALAGSGVFEAQHPDWRHSQSRAVRRACDESAAVWVAELDGVVAGFSAAVLHTEDRMGEIAMLAVDPPYQGRGIGSRLTAVATEWLGLQGMTTVMVETGGDDGHAPARAVYARAGFTLLPVARFFRTVP
ncbi:MAG: GNAT family N-acetyltransferase, partial [Actinomycetota bacterium]|nr:GNAT family N-acetyltransferase [Actinomycetota bacterium]